jgi:uncharacterized membrane protein
MKTALGHRWRQAALVAASGQVLLQLAWYLWLAPPTLFPPAFVVGLAVLPGLVPLLLAWVNFERGLLWAGFAALGYFSHGVMEAWTTPAVRGLALAETVLAVVLVACLTQAALVEKRAARAAQA